MYNNNIKYVKKIKVFLFTQGADIKRKLFFLHFNSIQILAHNKFLFDKFVTNSKMNTNF